MLRLNGGHLSVFVDDAACRLNGKGVGAKGPMFALKNQDFFAQIKLEAGNLRVRVVRAYAQEGAEIAAFNELTRLPRRI